MATYLGEDLLTVRLPTLLLGQRELVLVVQDESVFHTNDDEAYVWSEKGKETVLRPKGDGAGYHVSGFLSEKIGVLMMTEEQYEAYVAGLSDEEKDGAAPREAAKTMKIGKAHAGSMYGIAHDGYWNNDLLMRQLAHAIIIFEITHPGCQGLFLFDNSTGHGKYCPDALRAVSSRINVKPGGSQAMMRATTWKGTTQHMQFAIGDVVKFEFTLKKKKFTEGEKVSPGHVLLGVPKGSRQTLLERGFDTDMVKNLKGCCKSTKLSAEELEAEEDRRILELAGPGEAVVAPVHGGTSAAPCCLLWLLGECKDFKEQKSAIYELVEAKGHKCVFLPKFHPECNFIERYWGAIKAEARKQCDYTMGGLVARVPELLTNHCTLSRLRGMAGHAKRWMEAYGQNLTGVAAEFAVKKYSSHRGISNAQDQALERESAEALAVLVAASPAPAAATADGK